jgi:hypothetical protein
VSAFDISKAGLFKTINGGGSWAKIGNLDEPIRIRIDPNDTQHLYAADGVRGNTEGFWVSTDGGESWEHPPGFADLEQTEGGLFPWDVYDTAVDPTDFNHVLVSFHGAWGWTDSPWNTSSGVVESTDGGESWVVHPPGAWGTGHSINFLYNPELATGDSNTWLVGTQGPGMFRTTDAGESWTQVNEVGIQHGGGTVYYASTGVLYATGADSLYRSTDNGASFAKVGPSGGYNGIGGDGTRLYAGKGFSSGLPTSSLETDGQTWSDYGSQAIGGTFQIEYDSINGIVYATTWTSGIWALKPE